MNYYGFDWIGTILSLLSIYYVNRQKTVGFVYRIAGSIFWMAFGLLAQTSAVVFANMVIIFLSTQAILHRTARNPDR